MRDTLQTYKVEQAERLLALTLMQRLKPMQRRELVMLSAEQLCYLGKCDLAIAAILGSNATLDDYCASNTELTEVDNATKIGKYLDQLKLTANELRVLGTAKSLLGDREYALQAFSLACAHKDSNAHMFFGYGLLLGAANLLEEEMLAYRRAIELKNDYFEAWYNLGICLQAKDELEKAEASLHNCLAIESSFAPAHRGLGNLYSANTDLITDPEELTKRLEAAGTCYLNAVKYDPDCYLSWFNLSIVLNKLDKVEQAQAALQQIPEAVLKELVAESVSNKLEEDSTNISTTDAQVLEDQAQSEWEEYKEYDTYPELDYETLDEVESN